MTGTSHTVDLAIRSGCTRCATSTTYGLSVHQRVSAVLLGVTMPAFADAWIISAHQDQVWSASIRNERIAWLQIDCRVAPITGAEVTFHLSLPTKSPLHVSHDFTATFQIGTHSFTIPLTRIGEKCIPTRSFFGSAVMRNPSHLPSRSPLSLDRLESLVITNELDGTSDEFPYGQMSGAQVSDVVRRCGPSAIGARRRAYETSNIQNLLVFEREANDKCRGGSGDKSTTWDACDERTEYDERLNFLGMCYGKAVQYRVGARIDHRLCSSRSGLQPERMARSTVWRYGHWPSPADGTMPYKFNESRRHKIPKARYRVTNWPEYDAALVRRGSLTVWFTEEAVAAWHAPATGSGAVRGSTRRSPSRRDSRFAWCSINRCVKPRGAAFDRR